MVPKTPYMKGSGSGSRTRKGSTKRSLLDENHMVSVTAIAIGRNHVVSVTAMLQEECSKLLE